MGEILLLYNFVFTNCGKKIYKCTPNLQLHICTSTKVSIVSNCGAEIKVLRFQKYYIFISFFCNITYDQTHILKPYFTFFDCLDFLISTFTFFYAADSPVLTSFLHLKKQLTCETYSLCAADLPTNNADPVICSRNELAYPWEYILSQLSSKIIFFNPKHFEEILVK